MDRSVAQGRSADPEAVLAPDGPAPFDRPAPLDRRAAVGIGILLVLSALAIYGIGFQPRHYDHFVWQAAAFLEGHAAIRFPVAATDGSAGNAYFQDVLPIATDDGVARGLLPFPPLPAVLLVPFVAVWGLASNAQAIFTVLAAIDVAVCWWAIGRLPVGTVVRLGTTVFFAFGTVFWYTAHISTTWFQAHILAVGLTFLAIGLAAGADASAIGQDVGSGTTVTRPTGGPRWSARLAHVPSTLAIDPRQFAVGVLFGLACTARLTVVFGAPFFAFVGSGGSWQRRAWSAGLGAAIPILVLGLYDLATTGQLVSPAYDYLYRIETAGYPTLGYHADWAVEDPRYLVQNLGIGLFGSPDLLPVTLPDALAITRTPVCTDPGAVRGLFDLRCPLAVPRDTGMSVLLTSPAYLLAIPVLGSIRRSRIVAGAAVAVVAIMAVNLMHFSQGWVQFGYRFSNDAAPFALVLVALGFERLATRRRYGILAAMTLVVASIAINLWGVLWSRLLAW